MERPEILLTPGPVTVADDVLAALSRPVRLHYGEEWAALHGHVTAGLRRVFRTEGRVLLLFAPGMAALELAVGSLLGPGDEVLVPMTGRFARMLAEVARACRLRVHELPVEPLRPADPDAVEAALRSHGGVRALLLVHHETGLGLLNPVRELGQRARERGVLTVVDAVSSLGGVELEMDAWGIDACVAVANKCLAAPIGVAPVALGERALAALADGREKSAGWYLDARRWLRAAEERPLHPHPTTMPTNVTHALAVAVEAVLAEGLEAFQGRHAAAQRRVRDGLRELGFELLVPDAVASPVTTAVLGGGLVEVDEYAAWLLAEHGLRVAGGLEELASLAFRVGHMGRAVEPAVVDAYLAATADYLAR